MKLDIMIINSRHFTSKKDNKVYNTIDFILVSKDSFIDNDKFKGYSVATSFLNTNVLDKIKCLEVCQGVFDNQVRGLKSNLVLQKLVFKDGTTIDLV